MALHECCPELDLFIRCHMQDNGVTFGMEASQNVEEDIKKLAVLGELSRDAPTTYFPEPDKFVHPKQIPRTVTNFPIRTDWDRRPLSTFFIAAQEGQAEPLRLLLAANAAVNQITDLQKRRHSALRRCPTGAR